MTILTALAIVFALGFVSHVHAAKPLLAHHPHVPHHAQRTCHNKCRFRLCNYQTTFKIGKLAGVAFTGAICSNVGKKVGIVRSSGEAYVFEGNSIVKISKWHPKGLEKRFSSTLFKSYVIGHDNISGIGHEELQKSQLWFLNNRCVVLPLTSYQILHRYGYVVGEEHPKGSPLRDCVEFITQVASPVSAPVFNTVITPKRTARRRAGHKGTGNDITSSNSGKDSLPSFQDNQFRGF